MNKYFKNYFYAIMQRFIRPYLTQKVQCKKSDIMEKTNFLGDIRVNYQTDENVHRKKNGQSLNNSNLKTKLPLYELDLNVNYSVCSR